MTRAIIFGLCGVLGLSALSARQNPAAQPPKIAELYYFLGDWDCAGKFVRSGKSIEARQHFEPILDKSFVLFRHDDKPPHSYHAWAEWGWDGDSQGFVSTVQDSTGGTRLFHSPGWKEEKLVWSGGAPGKAEDQQFFFEKMSARQFRVGYEVLKDGSWTTVDVSTCTQTGVKNARR